ncbi:bacillithiol biosynthesis cysteine-adding enzyme BshC [Paenibacillus roseipurpureus]|uniref:Putative cysteine ligase BshC n=1 Tax=Paenibacillus roseopurpureus TaxID=2918901 RepID=A0AA96RM73_9BACL|nr:bacillithiol biosynthesis cysteine-adding enzyme BshC [Paenibacillus sp. MBLB1832]WNR46430.1 bacillithiol biosynthesis cysteine-adding enzyme BshC [Paenibacillus sp. MBLB1832]
MQMASFHWKKNQQLSEEYILGTEKALSLFPSHYGREADWQKRVQWLDGGHEPHADRKELTEVLRAYNTRVGNHDAALNHVQKLVDHETLAIVGGQQAGLFGGELLVLYKAVTILQLAREWSAKLDRTVVPIFWIAGEDHDFDEVNHIQLLSNTQQIEKIKVEHPTGQRTAVSRLPIASEVWEDALNKLDHSLMDTEFKAGLMERMRAVTAGDATLSDAFARWMALIFGEFGLVLIDADDPHLRKLEAAMFGRLIDENEAYAAALVHSQTEVSSAGYAIQAEIHPDGANLFTFAEGQRLLLHREGDLFTDKKSTVHFTKAELRDRAFTHPELMSNNVMSRPLMQEFLFPVLATVLGPGEIAYWALTKRAFEHFGLQMPIVAPRLEFTLIEGMIKKQMDKYNFSLADVLERFDEKKQAWLDEQDTLKLGEQFERVKASFVSSYGPLVESLQTINPGIKKLGDTNLAKIVEQIDYLQHKAAEATNTQFDAAIRQLERVRLTIFPLAKPQERVYNGCAYLNRYGHAWLHTLLETQIPVDGLHRVFYL